MSIWRPAVRAFVGVGLAIAVMLLYNVASQWVGVVVRPSLAPLPDSVIIDHFHLEWMLEAVFLGLAVVVRVPRGIVWVLGALVIPCAPHAVFTAVALLVAAPDSFYLRGEPQEAMLWLLESSVAGAICCAMWAATTSVMDALARSRPTTRCS